MIQKSCGGVPIEVCFSPALIGFLNIKTEAIVVVTDILRASTTMVSALADGATSIIPVALVEQAKFLKQQGFLVVAERGGAKLDFADFGNSAFEFRDGKSKGEKIVFTTTNGTAAINEAKERGTVAIGAFSNLSVLAEWLTNQNKQVIILCSGWENNFCLEDTVFAGALIEKLQSTGKFFINNNDSAHAALDLWNIAKKDILTYINKAQHRLRLQKLGADDVIEFSFTPDTAKVIPVLIENELIDILKPDL
ncbi:MAG TPA: 2-phosphosulfolactate phosphatase [Bacteroidales bacterium]|jgi:2-phosphosulfolactate phosphatase|nr:2-phosphosulfolactate phosphatase [Bacteroidales bacterium]OQC38710.1 MAG: putative 2-phosphosulfolactate phosphatase [Bacteroidetes bacterium ADurb.Bin041]HNV51195.1 2-phosphosulfolactate phosphatase [Bacteroidales bacterium]HOG66038.1 2-phosphosulfolactate phosphatase [Bacteroidales bacterium]HPW42665.1 2-phosphosulfolactate phosphatase [Bacteroidales bacterium]